MYLNGCASPIGSFTLTETDSVTDVCYFSVILSLSKGFKSESEFQSEFKSEFQKVRFLGFLVIYLKDYEYLKYISV